MKKILLIASAILIISTNSFAQLFEQNVTIEAPDYTISKLPSGNHSIKIDGYFSNNIPGYPRLPIKKIRIAIHPDADVKSIQLHYQKDNISNLGKFIIPESPTMATWRNNKQIVMKARNFYSNNRFLPTDFVALRDTSQLRKWKIVSLTYSPFQYNPVSKMLRMIPSVNVTLSYQIDTTTPRKSKRMQDNVMDNRVKNILENYSEARKWYELGISSDSSDLYNYVIITTDQIVSKSSKLTSFMANLTQRGFHPRIVTESDFGHLDAQSPNGRAEKIRKWLKDHYLEYGIEYVLLVGDPNPDDPTDENDDVGDIPMKMCWPRYTEDDEHIDAPTDYYYADLTGNWDLNDDELFGDYENDSGFGGVDFMNEVYVGRISVYNNDTDSLDQILEKTILYANAQNTQWRRKILMPMSFLDPRTDSAMLAEAMIVDYMKDADFEYWRQYMKGSVCSLANSIYEPEEELVSGVTINKWKSNKYGMVWWSGHGNSKGAYIGCHDCYDGTFMSSSYTSELNDNYPAFVFQCSCTNGLPEEPENLQFSLLKQGAIATYAASRVSWYMVADWEKDAKYYCDNFSIGYYLAKNLVQQKMNAGQAFFDLKSDLGENNNGYWDGCHWMNLFVMNLLGDPSIKLIEEGQVLPIIRTEPATDITCQSATLNGYINTNGSSLAYYFEYGETASYGNKTETVNLNADTGKINVKEQINNLHPDQAYFYRIVAKYDDNIVQSENVSFRTIQPMIQTTFPESVTIPINGKHEQTFEISNTGCGKLSFNMKIFVNESEKLNRINQIDQFVEKLLQKQRKISNISMPNKSKENPEKIIASKKKYPAAHSIQSNNASELCVCILGAEDDSDALDHIAQKIANTRLFHLVTYIDVSTFTPEISELQMFDALLIFSNYTYDDPYSLGNTIADYIETGGGVVTMMFDIERDDNWGLQGRFAQERYLTIPPAVPCARSPRLEMGKIYDPNHPIMNNIRSFDGGISSIRPGTTKVYSDVLRIADWEDGRPLVTAKILDCARRADLAFYPKSNEIFDEGWISNTDGHLLMANALQWVANHSHVNWLTIDETNGSIHTQESKTITLRYDANDLEPGEYKATIEISHNAENEKSPYSIPVSMIVKTTDIVVTPSELNISMPQNHKIIADLKIINGISKPLNWNIEKIQLVDSLGQDLPQNSQYTYVDSHMVNGPVFEWKNISSTGKLINGLRDDNYQGPFNFNFPFNFFGENYQSIYICSNGFIAFGPMSRYYSSYRNGRIPGERMPSNIIAWCWDDLHPKESSVFFQSDQDQAIIQINDYGQYNTSGTITAQIILKQSGEILVQYLKIESGFNIGSNTIGIANIDNSDGLLISYNQEYIQDKLALKIVRESAGVSVTPESGTINSNDETTLQVQFSSYGLAIGEYTGAIKIGFDDPNMSFMVIPLNLSVQHLVTDNEKFVHNGTYFVQYPYKPNQLVSTMVNYADNQPSIINNDNMKYEADGAIQSLKPTVIVTQIPEFNNRIVNLTGRVINILPSDCQIAVYLNNKGWINKPDSKNPVTVVHENGKWSCDITTVYGDHLARDIAIFLLTRDVSPVIMNGERSFPESFEKKALQKILLKR
jgi:hypothetical protein